MSAPFEGHRQLIPLAVATVCLLTPQQTWAGANATAQNANGITVIPNAAGLAIGLNSMGRACAKPSFLQIPIVEWYKSLK
jgi:hypothetical protein